MAPLTKDALFDPAKKTFSMFEEFKNFAFKGNVIDLAVGVIIGAAFGKIIASLVADIIMPLISVVTPANHGYQDWKWVIEGKDIPYGKFLGEVVNFLIVALVLFVFLVKFVGWLMRSKQAAAAAPPPPPAPTKEELLLTEIRDLLKDGAANK